MCLECTCSVIGTVAPQAPPLVEPLRSHSLSDSLLFRVNASATLRTTLVAGSAVFWAQHTLVTIW